MSSENNESHDELSNETISNQELQAWRQEENKVRTTAAIIEVSRQILHLEDGTERVYQNEKDIQEKMKDTESKIATSYSDLEHFHSKANEVEPISKTICCRTSSLIRRINVVVNGKFRYWVNQAFSIENKFEALKANDGKENLRSIKAMNEKHLQLKCLTKSTEAFNLNVTAVDHKIEALEAAIFAEKGKLSKIEAEGQQVNVLIEELETAKTSITRIESEIDNKKKVVDNLLNVQIENLTDQLDIIKKETIDILAQHQSVRDEEKVCEQLMNDYSSLVILIKSKDELEDMQACEIFQKHIMNQEFYKTEMEPVMELLSDQTNINKDLENYVTEEEALKQQVTVVTRELELLRSQKNQTVNLIKDIDLELDAIKKVAASIQDENTILQEEISNMVSLIAKELAIEVREAEEQMTSQLKLNMQLRSLVQRENDQRVTIKMKSEGKSSQMNAPQKPEAKSTQKPEEKSSPRNSILKEPGQSNEQKRRHVSFSTVSNPSYSPKLDTSKKRAKSFGTASPIVDTSRKRSNPFVGANENSSPRVTSPPKKLKRSPAKTAVKSQTLVKQEEKVEDHAIDGDEQDDDDSLNFTVHTSPIVDTSRKRSKPFVGANENSSPRVASPPKKLKRSPVKTAVKSQTLVKQEEKVDDHAIDGDEQDDDDSLNFTFNTDIDSSSFF